MPVSTLYEVELTYVKANKYRLLTLWWLFMIIILYHLAHFLLQFLEQGYVHSLKNFSPFMECAIACLYIFHQCANTWTLILVQLIVQVPTKIQTIITTY